MKRIVTFILTFITAIALFSCGSTDEKDEKLKIVATLFPQYDFACQISGGKADVIMLLPYGSESHTYEPSVKDMTDVSSCDIFLYTGSNMEPWAQTLMENSESNTTKAVDLSKNITPLEGSAHVSHDSHDQSSDNHAHDYDPHIWTSPKNAKIMVDEILSAICTADNENAEYYIQNAQKLKMQISALDEELSELSEKNSGKTMYFGGRFAFLYLFNDYGFKYASPYKGCSEESEPGIKTITDICDGIKKDKVRYIFKEEMSNNKVASSIADETDTELLILHSCHNLSKDEAKAGETYVTLMQKNIQNMRLALTSIR